MEMDEIVRMLKEMKEQAGRNTDAIAKIVDIEKRVGTGETERVAAKKELDALREQIDQSRRDFEDMKKRARVETLERGGFRDVRHAMTTVGACIRAMWARGVSDLPASIGKIIEREKPMVDEFQQQRATMLESGAVTGSYAVPTLFDVGIIDTLEEIQELSAQADFKADLPGNVDVPTLIGRPTFNHKRASKASEITKSAPSFGQVQVRPEEGTILFDADNQLLAMSPLALGDIFFRLMRESMMGALTVDLLLGDGTDNYNGITGLMKVTDAEDVYVLPAGKKAFADLSYQDLYNIQAKPLVRCAARGKWYGARNLFGVVAGIDCTGKAPLVRYESGKRLVLEAEYVNSEDMPLVGQSAANTAFLAFGDLQSYLVGLTGATNLALSKDSRFSYNQTQFRLVCYYDIVRKFKKGMVVVKTAAA